MPSKPRKAARKPRLSALGREVLRVNKTFGEAVKAAREGRGLSYRAGALELEITLSKLQELEKGSTGVTLAIAWRVARRLGINVDRTLREGI